MEDHLIARALLLPKDFHKHDFLSLMRVEPNARNRIRLLAMHHLQLGRTLLAVAEIVQHHWKTVQAWLSRFRQSGFVGLYDSPRSGAPEKISGKAERYLVEKIKTLSQAKIGGYITGIELQALLLNKHNISCSLKTVTVYNKLHQLGFSWITSRSMHPKSNEELQQAYKKTSKRY